MKKLLLIALLMGNTAQAITLVSSDKQEFEVADDVAALSVTINNFPGADSIKVTIPGDALKLTITAMQELKGAQDRASEDTRKYDLIKSIRFGDVTKQGQLIGILDAANYLEVDLVMHAAAIQIAHQIEKGIDPTKVFGQIGGDLQRLVAKHYAIAFKEQIPGIKFVPSVSIDDVLEYRARQIKPIDGVLDLSSHQLTSAQGIEKVAKQYPNLTYLDLDNNQLASLPDNLNLPDLHKLYLKNNLLTSLPDKLNLPSLEVLDLQNNQLASLPDNLNLPDLRWLDLQNNQLTSLPNNLNLPELELLDLDNNQLASLPNNLNLPGLRQLHLDNNQLASLPDNLNLPDLRYLYLENNELASLPDNLNLPALLDLYLLNNQLDKQEKQRIQRALPNTSIAF